MRIGSVYKRDRTANESNKGAHYTSVSSRGVDRIKMYLRMSIHVEPASYKSFLDALRSFLNQNIWHHMYLDEDGGWIVHALLNGTLNIAYGGFYQPKIIKEVYYTAVWV